MADLQAKPDFFGMSVSNGQSPWCVDGRPDFHHEKGPQMLGGSLQTVLLWCIENNKTLNESTLKQILSLLKEKGFGTGAHRGHHHDPEKNASDCGFADKMPLIFQTAIEKKAEIRDLLLQIYEANKTVLGEMDMEKMLDEAFSQFEKYGAEKIKLTGEKLVSEIEKEGSQVVENEGEHMEAVAFVNLKEGTTLDTNGLNKNGQQGFNLDLWMTVKQAKAIGIEENFAISGSLILYLATEIVLVEMKGKPRLPVVINS